MWLHCLRHDGTIWSAREEMKASFFSLRQITNKYSSTPLPLVYRVSAQRQPLSCRTHDVEGFIWKRVIAFALHNFLVARIFIFISLFEIGSKLDWFEYFVWWCVAGYSKGVPCSSFLIGNSGNCSTYRITIAPSGCSIWAPAMERQRPC